MEDKWCIEQVKIGNYKEYKFNLGLENTEHFTTEEIDLIKAYMKISSHFACEKLIEKLIDDGYLSTYIEVDINIGEKE